MVFIFQGASNHPLKLIALKITLILNGHLLGLQ